MISRPSGYSGNPSVPSRANYTGLEQQLPPKYKKTKRAASIGRSSRVLCPAGPQTKRALLRGSFVKYCLILPALLKQPFKMHALAFLVHTEKAAPKVLR